MADPGFPRGGGANPKGGHQHIIWPIFAKNCMKMKKFWARGGVPCAPLDTPLDILELQVAHVSPGKFRRGNKIRHWIHHPHASQVNKMLVEILFLILEVIKY